MRFSSSGIFVAIVFFSTIAASAAPRVTLDLVTEPGFPINGAQRWLNMLKDLDFDDIKIRSSRPGDRSVVKQRGSGDGASYQVTGVLTARNSLRLQAYEFRLGDKAGVSRWLEQLRSGGSGGGNRSSAFGMTAEELVAIHEALSLPIRTPTKGKRSYDVLKSIARGIGLPFSADAQALQTLSGDGVVADDLGTLSSGTAMAAVLRPMGLVLVPQKKNDDFLLTIVDVRQAAESWPVGWPAEEAPRETLPELFNFLNVEIKDTPLSSALEALRDRIEAPILFDHNSLARQRIDPATVNVSMPSGRTYYKRIIDRLLNQAQLTSELRVDEAGKPFLWVSTLKR